MPNLVPIPWQPAYYLTPSTLARLIRASQILGHNIIVVDAWRSYAQQKSYWDAYQAYLKGGPYAPTASNPDTGQRNHMRGAAFDARDTDGNTQSACRQAGLIRDNQESWHWNDPNWGNMPIIPTNIITTGEQPKPLPPVLKIRKLETVFAFLRNPSTGEISLLDYGNMTRRALPLPEWKALAANGNAYSNATTTAEYASVIKNFAVKS